MSEIKLFKSKAYWGVVLAMLMASIGLMSCGGGGGDSAVPPTAVGRVFFDDFESYSLAALPEANGWSGNGTRDLPQIVASATDSSGTPHGGSRMMRLNWDGTVDFSDDSSFTTAVLGFSYKSEFLIRMWWRADFNFGTNPGSDWDGPGEGCKLMRLNQLVNGGFGIIEILGGGGLTHEYFTAPDDTVFLNNFGVMSPFDHAWHKVELYVKVHATQGIVRRWTDGVMVYEGTGLDTTGAASTSWSPLIMGSNWSGNPGWNHTAVNHFYVDDVEIFSDTGIGAPGSMANATIKK